MTDAQDTLESRLFEAHGVVTSLNAEGQFEVLSPEVTANAMSAVQVLLEQAQDAFQEMCGPMKTNRTLRESEKVIKEMASAMQGMLNVMDTYLTEHSKTLA